MVNDHTSLWVTTRLAHALTGSHNGSRSLCLLVSLTSQETKYAKFSANLAGDVNVVIEQSVIRERLGKIHNIITQLDLRE